MPVSYKLSPFPPEIAELLEDIEQNTQGLSDVATETTLASIDTKLGGTIDVDTGLDADLAALLALDFATETTLVSLEGKDFATQTTLANVDSTLTGIAGDTGYLPAIAGSIASVDTYTQSSATSLNSLLGLLTLDFATQTTLSDLNSKDFATEYTLSLIASDAATLAAVDFATETTLQNVDTELGSIFAFLSSDIFAELQSIESTNTSIESLTTNIDASLQSIDVNTYNLWDFFYYNIDYGVGSSGSWTQRVAIASDCTVNTTFDNFVFDSRNKNVAVSFTRPADTNIYASGDLVANSTTAGSVAPMSFNVQSTSNASQQALIERVRLRKSNASVQNTSFRLHLYAASPGVTNGDNGVFLSSQAANYLGSFDILNMQAFSDGAASIGYPTHDKPIRVAGVSTVFGLLEALGAYTPASAEQFTVTLESNYI